jgi:hypothetical protein
MNVDLPTPEDGCVRPKHVADEYTQDNIGRCIQDGDNTYVQKINGNATGC